MFAALVTTIVTFVMFAGLSSYDRFDRLRQRSYLVGVGILGLAYAAQIGSVIVAGIRRPPEWDFFCFWLYGRTALLGQVYDPRAYERLGRSLAVTPDFVAEILRVACPYPPPNLIWFFPLGLIPDLKMAALLWSVWLSVIVVLALGLVWRLVLARRPTAVRLVFTVFALGLQATLENASATQIIYMALLWIVLALEERDPIRRGIWLALASCVKPFLIVLPLVSIFRREWKTLVTSAAVILFLTLVSTAVIGIDSLAAFVRDNPIGRTPAYVFSEPSNQSLLGWIVRASGEKPGSHFFIARHGSYLAASSVVLAITLVAAFRTTQRIVQDALFLLAGMLVYPGTLAFYPVLLIVPVVVFWRLASANGDRRPRCALARAGRSQRDRELSRRDDLDVRNARTMGHFRLDSLTEKGVRIRRRFLWPLHP